VKINKAVINVNERITEGLLAKAYDAQLDKLIHERESLMEEEMLETTITNVTMLPNTLRKLCWNL